MEKTTQQEAFEQAWRQLCEASDGIEGILSKSEAIHKSRTIGNADEYRTQVNGRDVLIKTFKNRPWVIRVLFGRRSLRNEFDTACYIFRNGLARIPEPYLMPDQDTILMEFVPTIREFRNARHYPKERLPLDFHKEIESSVNNLHSHKIAHGDIRRTNILITQDMHPCFIDLASAINLNTNNGLIRKFLFRWLKKADNYAVAKIWLNDYPQELSDKQRKILEPPWYLKLGHFYRLHIYKRLFNRHI